MEVVAAPLAERLGASRRIPGNVLVGLWGGIMDKIHSTSRQWNLTSRVASALSIYPENTIWNELNIYIYNILKVQDQGYPSTGNAPPTHS